ncbi:MAG: response regulator, partial [Desulfobacteraceae bacterium]|nr:response regulator [Desulfobacteraceae bacterium]
MAILDRKFDSIKFSSKSAELFWKVLVIDDEQATHDIMDKALKGLSFSGKSLSVLHADSRDTAKTTIKDNPNIALILLDITLETKKAGFELVHWIRKEQKDTCVQIVIHTGNSDIFLEQEVVEAYDINDYLAKTDATFQRLQTLVKKSIRSFATQSALEDELAHRKKIEIKLKEKEILLQDLIDNIGDILWQTDREYSFTNISNNVETITGYEKTGYKDQPFFCFMTEASKKEVWPEIRSLMNKRENFLNIEISRKNKKGDVKYYFTSGSPFYNDKNEFQGFRGAEKDITDLALSKIEKEKLFSQLRHAQRLEAMGTLAGGIAHDFNNILGGILGYAQLLQFELENNQTGISYTDQILSGCDRAKSLVLQILDFSRQRETISSPKITDPVNIVQKALKLLRASIPSSIKIHSDIAQHVGFILADPQQIHQAVMNLCTNARQAIENSMGQITIQVKKICLDSSNHIRNPNLNLGFGDFITISVQDTGKGIETDTLEKIFNPYFTTKDRGDGTGLGLSVVHGIVTRFNGTITTDTCPGKGTTFTLYFPKHKEKERTKDKNRLIQGEASVLFIDDEPTLVDLGKKMLEKLGYKVTATNFPLNALEYIQKEPYRFDIVITDMTMPDIHGTQLAKKIKLINH